MFSSPSENEYSWVQKIGNEIITKVIEELKKENNMKAFQTSILRPILRHTLQYLYPYILVTSIVFFMTFIFACAILILVVRGQYV